MAGYIVPPIAADPDTILTEILDYLMANVPGWSPHWANPEVIMAEVFARIQADTRTLAASMFDAALMYFGRSILGVVPLAEAYAEVYTTWTAIDTQGYRIEAGTVAAFRVAGDEVVQFAVVADVVIPPGASTTAVSGVTMRALEPGTYSNGHGPGPMELIDRLSWVATVDGVVATNTSSGGVEAETDRDYLDRLTEELELLAPRPILARDAAIMARRVAGVERALGLDNYDPDTDTWDNERMITVAIVAADGDPVPAPVKAAVANLLEAERETNFVFNVVDPTYTSVDVTFEISVDPGYIGAEVLPRAVEAVTAYLDPGMWAGGDQQPPVWVADEAMVRYFEVSTVLNNVEGVRHVEDLTINGGTVNVALDGVAALPSVGVITGTLV